MPSDAPPRTGATRLTGEWVTPALSLVRWACGIDLSWEVYPDAGNPLRSLLVVRCPRLREAEVAYLRTALRAYAEENGCSVTGLAAERGGRVWRAMINQPSTHTGAAIRDPLTRELREALWGRHG